MDAATALAGLEELSDEVVEAVVLDPNGAVEASVAEGDRAALLAGAAQELLAAAADVRPTVDPPSRIEVSLPGGTVFVVREGERTIAAVTRPEPIAGLVVYDLRTVLRSIDSAPPASKPRRRRKAASPDA